MISITAGTEQIEPIHGEGRKREVASLRAEVGNLRTHLASVARDIKELRTGGAGSPDGKTTPGVAKEDFLPSHLRTSCALSASQNRYTPLCSRPSFHDS